MQYELSLCGIVNYNMIYGSAVHSVIHDLSSLMYNDSVVALISQLNAHESVDSDVGVKSIVNHSMNRSLIEALKSKYDQLNQSNKRSFPENSLRDNNDIISIALRQHWPIHAFVGNYAMEKSLRMRYIQGVNHFIRRELNRISRLKQSQGGEHNSSSPLVITHSEFPFSILGSTKVETGATVDYKFRGIFDRIEKTHPNTTSIVEFKSTPTGKTDTHQSLSDTVDSYYTFQLACYSKAFEELFHHSPSDIRLERVESGVSVSYSPQQLESVDAVRRIHSFVNNICCERYDPNPSSYGCSNCDYRFVCKHSLH